MVLFVQKLLYSGKKCFISSIWFIVQLEESGCIRGKMVVFAQNGCIRAKVVVLGQNWLYSGKWLNSGKSGCIQAKVVVFGESGCIR